MSTLKVFAMLLLLSALFTGCGGSKSGDDPTGPGGSGSGPPPSGSDPPATSVSGTMSFVLGGTAGVSVASANGLWGAEGARRTQASAGAEYIVSPRKAKITFTSVVFRGLGGETLGTSPFDACVVTYDRSLATGSTLLNCGFTAPIGDIQQLAVYFDKVLELLVSDAEADIYSDPSSPTGFTTVAPVGGATYVPFTVTIGQGTSRATPIIFPSVLSITESSTPVLFITTDMIHTLQLQGDSGGVTLSPVGANNDPVALFGGPTRGTSRLYSTATTIEAVPVGIRQVRVFYDEQENPLYLIGPTCGEILDGPKGAWASPPIGGTVGGWLGRDSSGTVSWALPTTTEYSTYASYLVMHEPNAVGEGTLLNCKATANPPPPGDGRTYASGAPGMDIPTTQTHLTLLTR